MSGGWKDVVKSGWQQGKEGSSTLKNHVKGLVNRGDNSASPPTANHVATPRSALRDPASFAPPPRHIAGNAPYAGSSHDAVGAPDTSGAMLPYHAQQPQQIDEPVEPKPYRYDTTGLSTSHYPPPPPRPTAHSSNPAAKPVTAAINSKVPPALPPRLPPRVRTNTTPPNYTGSQAPSQGYLNQGAVNNLGAAGISVPGLGIRGDRAPPPPPPGGMRLPPRPTTSPTQVPAGQVDELQARFARMGASPSFQANGGGTAGGSTQQRLVGQVLSVVGKKKPPPPPAPKRPGLSRTGADADTPPPIPLATRPKF